eukprot:TRINITY_DN2240_c0_g1_i1.p1 TRINITY_DN2240_c0_g1~~TRINITY_DN2240_c0_g1_i1.p1  ORF type:complete len:227 (-),score=66.19 TRINITY_DN2240_c0_g1_i1:13-693(-)
MTFFHFLNCLTLTFAPYFVIYKSTALSEFSSFSTCLWAAVGYTATQLAKLMFFATFVPPATDASAFEFLQEFSKIIVGLLEMIGIYSTLNWKYVGGEGEAKLLGVGLGWATAESIFMKLAPLWLGARALEFDWSYILLSLEANVNLMSHMSMVVLVWLWSRKNIEKGVLYPLVVASIVAGSIFPVVLDFLKLQLQINGWSLLILSGIFNLALGFSTYSIYNKYKIK